MTPKPPHTSPLIRWRQTRSWDEIDPKRSTRRNAFINALRFTRLVVILHVIRGRGVMYRMDLTAGDAVVSLAPGAHDVLITECTFTSNAKADDRLKFYVGGNS